ncbi:lipopolysaccharide transport periplasmic protein LptA [Otariodibacter oris]|uniref:Lipopolysaccharide export system protein LptA n=1 Tax=Otariodibacter oris TaxID=1032623 RepID=A0A420XI59_9PAST|nr:lipopolysaccharide transport periplasmic protein LptA [Otariodibacter oris]QGM80983.1 lipopolysaccharide transport periplasmic protein LptA [Otariodibacter oris]RKR76838.1 lipopolysaccharide export system protein LptA [Otariodibacter oris]
MKFLIKPLFMATFIGISLNSYALKGDTDQPINITSGSQSLDLESNTVIFSDNVLITQGSIKINAAKVTIIRKEGQREKIEAIGSPAKFEQTMDDGKPANGQANQINYDLGSEFLILTGNAELKQLDSSIKANKITYDVKKQQLKATSGNKSRVTTILIPTQLQNTKNKK